ncbi:MAG: Na+/H+ antiporter NhaC [Bacteroidales bacterium]|nr:Na+/H+ antiporter NhaC [Bacteroidales bacterium]
MKRRSSPTTIQSVIPLLALVGLICVNVLMTSDDPMSGANQTALIFASLIGGIIAACNGVKWDEIFNTILKIVTAAASSILILLTIGALSGTWMMSGVTPAMIYYGLYVLRPSFFLPATVIIASVISVFTGSSWSTIATIGVAMLGIGHSLGFNDAVVAGAIISGAYFGDKISPLSDTTNIASSVCEVDLFTHIRYMLRTTIPTIVITLLIFAGISIFHSPQTSQMSASEMQQAIKGIYHITPWVFLVPAVVIFMIAKKVPALVTLLTGATLGAVATVIFQPDLIHRLAGGNSFNETYSVVMRSFYGHIQIVSDTPALGELFSTEGMAGMLNTIWLALCALVFGGIMEAGGFLGKITSDIIRKVSSTGGLVTSTAFTCILANIVTAEQYITLIINGNTYKEAYRERKLAPELLSRTIEDGGTATSVLVPWNSCGATQAKVLGVPTLAYLPFAFFCWLSPLVTIFVAWLGLGIRKKKE